MLTHRVPPLLAFDPMAETANIAEMALKVSKDVFSIFGWEIRGPKDKNWPCLKDHRKRATPALAAAPEPLETAAPEDIDPDLAESSKPKKSKKSKTHPSDVVFRYDDPYSNAAVYLTVDLKSYAAGTITKTNVRAALRSLCASVDCANVVPEWAASYVSGDDLWHAHGMLFVYNHDAEYDPKRFRDLVIGATPATIRVPTGRRVYVFGPGEITHLHAVARDLKVFRGDNLGVDFQWFTPDLITRKSKGPSFGTTAPAEVLLGPWQIAGVVQPDAIQPSSLRMYYRATGDVSVTEMEYLLEYMFRYVPLQAPGLRYTAMFRWCLIRRAARL